MKEENDGRPLALAEWAVTCDALARGEQILLLRGDRLEPSGSGGAAALPRDVFWLYPVASGQSATRVTDPYRDRMRALDELERGDGRVRLQYVAAAEHVERIRDRDRLLALDGHHTLNRSAVDDRLKASAPRGVVFMILRVYRRESAVLVEETRERRAAEGWIPVEGSEALALDRAEVEADMEPVLDDGRFLERKAELLQLSGSIRAL